MITHGKVASLPRGMPYDTRGRGTTTGALDVSTERVLTPLVSFTLISVPRIDHWGKTAISHVERSPPSTVRQPISVGAWHSVAGPLCEQ